MKAKSILISIIMYSHMMFSQTKFSKAVGGPESDEALYCKPTNDGGYISVGWTKSYGAGNWDLYLVKTDSEGALLWTKTYGGPGDEVDCSIEQTTDGGYIIASRSNSFSAVSSDIYLVKTDGLGNLEWSKTYGGNDWEEGHSIIVVNNGYLHVGYTKSFGAGNEDIYVMKNDLSGNIIWANSYGGTNVDLGHKIKTDIDGNVLIVGGTNSFSGDHDYDFYLLKIDANGNLLWNKTFGGWKDDIGWDVAATDNAYYLCGLSESNSAGENDLCLMKVDFSGNLRWSKLYGGGADDGAYSISQTSDNALLLVGATESFGNGDEDICAIKLDTLGNVLWAKTYGGAGEDDSQYGQATPDGGFIISGYTSSFGAGGWDFYLIKTDANGDAGGCNETSFNVSANSQNMTAHDVQTIVQAANFVTYTANSGVSIGGTINDCSVTAINENVEDKLITVFPNPTNNAVTISLPQDVYSNTNELKYDFRNVMGQTILQGKVTAKSQSVNIESLTNGIYLLVLTQNNTTISKQKVIKN